MIDEISQMCEKVCFYLDELTKDESKDIVKPISKNIWWNNAERR